MTDLVLRAFNKEKVERIPVGFWFHFLPPNLWDAGLLDASILKRNMEGHREFIEAFDPDMVKIMSDGFFTHPIHQIGNIYDLLNVKEISGAHPWINSQVELAARVVKMKKGIPYFYNIFSPLTNLRFILGKEKLLEYWRADSYMVRHALDKMTSGFLSLIKGVVKYAGCAGIYLSVQNPDADSISDDEYHRVAGASDTRLLSAANELSDNNILHICGYDGVKNRLPAWKDYKAKAYNWAVAVDKVDLRAGKELFGGACVIGGFSNTADSRLATGTKESILNFTRQILNYVGRTGLVLGADCTVPGDLPLERLRWVREAGAL